MPYVPPVPLKMGRIPAGSRRVVTGDQVDVAPLHCSLFGCDHRSKGNLGRVYVDLTEKFRVERKASYRILLLSRDEILGLTVTSQLANLFKEKEMQLTLVRIVNIDKT